MSQRLQPFPLGELKNVAFTDDGSLIAAASTRGVSVWSSADGRLLLQAGTKFSLVSAAIYGKRVATLDEHGKLRAWSLDGKVVKLAGPPGLTRLQAFGERLIGWNDNYSHALNFDAKSPLGCSRDGATIAHRVGNALCVEGPYGRETLEFPDSKPRQRYGREEYERPECIVFDAAGRRIAWWQRQQGGKAAWLIHELGTSLRAESRRGRPKRTSGPLLLRYPGDSQTMLDGRFTESGFVTLDEAPDLVLRHWDIERRRVVSKVAVEHASSSAALADGPSVVGATFWNEIVLQRYDQQGRPAEPRWLAGFDAEQDQPSQIHPSPDGRHFAVSLGWQGGPGLSDMLRVVGRQTPLLRALEQFPVLPDRRAALQSRWNRARGADVRGRAALGRDQGRSAGGT